MINKKIIFGCAFVLALCACNNKKTTVNENGFELPVFEFNEKDSAEVRTLTDDYVARFNAGELERAADMLYVVVDSAITPLSAEQRAGFLKAMTALPKYGCQVKEMELLSNRDNRVRIAMKIIEQGDFETGKGTINFFLNPVLVDGKWYLTLLDNYAEGVGMYHKK